MQMFKKKWLTHVMLLFVALALAVTFTSVAQAGGGEEEPDPETKEEGPSMAGKPPMGKPPMGKPVKPIPELANCIGVTAFYDGNLNGIVDANEDAMDGASIVLMQEAPEPSEDPPIGPDGKEITMEKPMGAMPPMGKPMGPPPGPMKPMGPPAAEKPVGPPPGEGPTGPPMGPPPGQRPAGPPMGPPPPEKPMGPPPGMMAEKKMPVKPTPQYQVLDRQLTRDGGMALFCDLKPGTYVLQGDAVEGITFGANRLYVRLEEDDYQLVLFGFTYLNGAPEPTNGNGA
jgi:hypothetical protein